MQAQPPMHTFDAKPTLPPGGQVQWELCRTDVTPKECGNSPGTYPKVVLEPNSGKHNFKFTITNDNTGLNIKFADKDPAWVAKGAKPKGPGLDEQIDGPPTGNGTPVLVFGDKNTLPDPTNPSPVILKYQLNFKGDGGAKIPPIDPDIRNGGTGIVTTPPPGGTAGYVDPTAIYAKAAIISALVAALVAFLVVRLMTSRRA